MTATNQILQFCGTDTGSNLLTQSEYASDTQRSIGNQPGVARSGLVNKVLRQTSFVAAAVAKAVITMTGQDVLDDADSDGLAEKLVNGIKTSGAVPLGCPQIYFGSTAPAGHVLCYGQALSRTTYSALFAILGTTYGAGDGSTTFNIPDMRGFVPAGKDNMGGTAANRITTAVSGLDGTTLGATGGDQRMQNHVHNNTVSETPHAHDANCVYGAAGNNPSGGAVTYETSGTGNRVVTKTASAGVSITNASAGAGSSQNVQPTIVVNYILRTGI